MSEMTNGMSQELGRRARPESKGHSLESPFERAVYMMFLVSEVHPFADGNGRIARVMMNAELVAGGEERIVIPTVFHGTCVAALRMLSRTGRAEPLLRVLDHAQRWTIAVDWSSLNVAERELAGCNAFLDSDEAEAEGKRPVCRLRR